MYNRIVGVVFRLVAVAACLMGLYESLNGETLKAILFTAQAILALVIAIDIKEAE